MISKTIGFRGFQTHPYGWIMKHTWDELLPLQVQVGLSQNPFGRFPFRPSFFCRSKVSIYQISSHQQLQPYHQNTNAYILYSHYIILLYSTIWSCTYHKKQVVAKCHIELGNLLCKIMTSTWQSVNLHHLWQEGRTSWGTDALQGKHRRVDLVCHWYVFNIYNHLYYSIYVYIYIHIYSNPFLIIYLLVFQVEGTPWFINQPAKVWNRSRWIFDDFCCQFQHLSALHGLAHVAAMGAVAMCSRNSRPFDPFWSSSHKP